VPNTAKHILSGSRAMAADADIVFNTAADLTRATAWLPAAVEVVDADTVEVTWPPDGEAHRYAITVRAEELRLAWRPVGPRGWPGHLLVTDKGAGSSEVELRVECGDDVAPDEVRRVLDRALGGLATEVLPRLARPAVTPVNRRPVFVQTWTVVSGP
jgi:hypothetical protein